MSVFIEKWAEKRRAATPEEVKVAEDMAENVHENAAAFLLGQRAIFMAAFNVDSAIHEKALEIFVPKLHDLPGYQLSGRAEVTERDWVDNSRDEHTLIEISEQIAEHSGRIIVAKSTSWGYTDPNTGLFVAIPYSVNYRGEHHILPSADESQ